MSWLEFTGADTAFDRATRPHLTNARGGILGALALVIQRQLTRAVLTPHPDPGETLCLGGRPFTPPLLDLFLLCLGHVLNSPVTLAQLVRIARGLYAVSGSDCV